MTLTFLGQTYEVNTTEVTSTPSEVTGLYQGVPINFSKTHVAPRSHVAMSYRGVHYVR